MSNIKYAGILRLWFIRRSGKGMVVIHSHGKVSNIDQIYLSAHGQITAACTDGKLYLLTTD